MEEFWGSFHVYNRNLKSSKRNGVDAAPSLLNTSPWCNTHSARSTQDPAQGNCPKHSPGTQEWTEGCWLPENPPSISPDITLPSRDNQTLACLSTPTLATVNSKTEQLNRTDELTRRGVPTSFYLQGLAGEALLNSADKGHLYHEETRAHQPRQKTLPSTGCHTSMDIKPNISKTSLPPPPVNGTIIPISDDVLATFLLL